MHMRDALFDRRRATLAAFGLGLAALLVSSTGSAVEVRGVEIPNQTTVEGQQLRLNGAGARTMFGFPTYVAGLYLENPTRDAQQAIQSNQIKRIHLHMLRDLSQQQFTDAVTEGIRKNTTPQEFQQFQPKIQQLTSALPDLRQGQMVDITYVPQRGLTVEAPGVEPQTIQGEDFAQAAFEIWLGENPAQASLKQELLQGGVQQQPATSLR